MAEQTKKTEKTEAPKARRQRVVRSEAERYQQEYDVLVRKATRKYEQYVKVSESADRLREEHSALMRSVEFLAGHPDVQTTEVPVIS